MISRKQKKQTIPELIKAGNYESIKNYLKDNISVNNKVPAHIIDAPYGKLKDTMLHLAILENKNDIAELLMELGANVEKCNDKGKKAMHYAAINGNLEGMKLLVNNQALIECDDNHYRTPIHHAVEYGHTEVVKFLVAKKAIVDNDTRYYNRVEGWHERVYFPERVLKLARKNKINFQIVEEIFQGNISKTRLTNLYNTEKAKGRTSFAEVIDRKLKTIACEEARQTASNQENNNNVMGQQTVLPAGNAASNNANLLQTESVSRTSVNLIDLHSEPEKNNETYELLTNKIHNLEAAQQQSQDEIKKLKELNTFMMEELLELRHEVRQLKLKEANVHINNNSQSSKLFSPKR